MKKIISGIQQMGIGNRDVHQLWTWYRKAFGADVKVFEEAAEAPLMTQYTGGEVHKRNAVLAMNMQGGGGFEIWQFTSREPLKPKKDVQLGDLGIAACKLKARNVKKAYDYFKKQDYYLHNTPTEDTRGNLHFYVSDPEGNLFEIVQGNDWFGKTKAVTGGVFGAVIGVSDIEKSLPLYRDLLEHNMILSDKTEVFPDLFGIPGGARKMRRVVLQNGSDRKGPFGKLLGNSQIELLQCLDETPAKIFENRYWGDLGFIHLCFDVKHMDALKLELEANDYPFTIDSANSFDMGEAAGRFAYIEDPDGTLIEFVETHKIPLIKKLNWYLDLRKRPAEKALPWWVFKAMSLSRVK